MDALSDDRRHALTLIAFIGSVFSPYYAFANRKGPAPAEEFCAINLALYSAGASRWCMSERGAGSLIRNAAQFRLGRSALTWDGVTLTARIDERGAPIPRRLRGTIRLTPGVLHDESLALDPAGRHRWRPIAPAGRVEIAFADPALCWRGQAYLDSNDGDVPLAGDFDSWHWSRASTPAGAMILYDVRHRDGGARSLALRFGPDGARRFTPPPARRLPASFWRLSRWTRADAGQPARVLKTLEDAPFYARSLVAATIGGEAVTCIHESLSLTRFKRPWTQAMLPFRMPRYGWPARRQDRDFSPSTD